MSLQFLNDGFSGQPDKSLDRFFAEQYERTDQAFYRLALIGGFHKPGTLADFGGSFGAQGPINGNIGNVGPEPGNNIKPSKSNTEYFESVLPYARQAHQVYGVPISIILAQSALESRYGRSELAAKYNNFFGVKARKGQASVSMPTREYRSDGSSYTIRADFRVYPGPYESFADHGRLVTSGRYSRAVPFKNDPKQFITEVWKAGYATDPSYVGLVWGVVHSNNLTKYDEVGP